MKSPITYYGAKTALAEKIFQYVPHKMDRYVEPFFGSGGLFFSRPRWAEIEIINDINQDVINFFRVLRDKPQKLIEALQLTPHARQEIRDSTIFIKDKRSSDVTRALYFFVRANQSFAGNMRATGGWTLPLAKNKAQEWKNKTDPALLYEVARRLSFASFECNPALKVMKQYDKAGSFMYLDPPYLSVASDKDKEQSYQGYDMKEADHKEFIKACLKMKSMMMVSGYDHELYTPLVEAGWRKIEIPYTVKSINNGKSKDIVTDRIEILWVSPNVQYAQNTLF